MPQLLTIPTHNTFFFFSVCLFLQFSVDNFLIPTTNKYYSKASHHDGPRWQVEWDVNYATTTTENKSQKIFSIDLCFYLADVVPLFSFSFSPSQTSKSTTSCVHKAIFEKQMHQFISRVQIRHFSPVLPYQNCNKSDARYFYNNTVLGTCEILYNHTKIVIIKTFIRAFPNCN